MGAINHSKRIVEIIHNIQHWLIQQRIAVTDRQWIRELCNFAPTISISSGGEVSSFGISQL
jgi:hypothetical protein